MILNLGGWADGFCVVEIYFMVEYKKWLLRKGW